MQSIRRWLLMVLVPLFLVGTTAACAPADEPAEDAGEELVTEAPAEDVTEEDMDEPEDDMTDDDGEALTIGALLPFTGDLSDFGAGMFQAAQLAVDEINAAGGVNGQPIELVQGDTGTAPQTGTEEARRLIEVEGVDAIVGAASSGVTLAIAESVTGPAGVVQISPASTSPGLTTATDDDYLFRTTISDAAQGVVLAQLASDQGYASVCSLYVNNAYGEGLSEVFANEFTELGGTITAQVPHEQEQPSYVSEISNCTEAEPDAMAAISYPESARVYLREAIEQEAIDTLLFVDGTKSDEMFADLGWDNFEGMWGTAPGALDTEAGEGFDDRYEAAFGERPPLPFLRESYDAVYLIALAAQSAGSTDSTAIRDALRDVANPDGETVRPGPEGWTAALSALEAGDEIDYDGAASPANLDENGDVLVGAIEIWQIEGGEIVTVETREIDLSAGATAE